MAALLILALGGCGAAPGGAAPSRAAPTAAGPTGAGTGGATATPRAAPTAVSGSIPGQAGSGGPTGAAPTGAEGSSPAFELASGAFSDGGPIPVRFTCDGADISPPLAWNGQPAVTAAFVLLVEDVDAAGFVHWLAGPIPASATRIPEGAPATDPPQAANGFGRPGWGGPCPPSGTHRYVFRLAALPANVSVPVPLTSGTAHDLLGRALSVATLTGTYGRP